MVPLHCGICECVFFGLFFCRGEIGQETFYWDPDAYHHPSVSGRTLILTVYSFSGVRTKLPCRSGGGKKKKLVSIPSWKDKLSAARYAGCLLIETWVRLGFVGSAVTPAVLLHDSHRLVEELKQQNADFPDISSGIYVHEVVPNSPAQKYVDSPARPRRASVVSATAGKLGLRFRLQFWDFLLVAFCRAGSTQSWCQVGVKLASFNAVTCIVMWKILERKPTGRFVQS